LAIYESQAQDFLKRLLVLCHITSGQPLRQPELLSVRWRNTDRIRHILLWEKRVLIHTQYHKGQQQSGAYKENIRFLPRPVGHLLLDYLAYVMPLRQLFLRQQQPKALISPYLWATPALLTAAAAQGPDLAIPLGYARQHRLAGQCAVQLPD